MWDSSLKGTVVPKCKILSQFFLLTQKWKLPELEKLEQSHCRTKKIPCSFSIHGVYQQLWDLRWPLWPVHTAFLPLHGQRCGTHLPLS